MGTQLEEFVDNYNSLVIDEEGTAYYQVIHAATEEVWHTFPCPAEASKIEAAVSNMSGELPSGNHSVRVQAISERSKQVRAQIALAVTGRSAAAKASANDAKEMAKAVSMHVETADKQLVNMSRRLEEANERARQAEERAGEMMSKVFEVGDLLNKFIWEKEAQKLDAADREARNQSFIIIATAIAPVLNKALEIGAEIGEIWVKDKKEEMALRYQRRQREREREAASDESASAPSHIDTEGEAEDARSPQH